MLLFAWDHGCHARCTSNVLGQRKLTEHARVVCRGLQSPEAAARVATAVRVAALQPLLAAGAYKHYELAFISVFALH